MTSALNPDQVAELEREQSFLLRSLDDLDAELQAADLESHDHEQLSDDYTRRLAEVTRALDENRTAYAKIDNRLNSRQRILTVAGIVIVAVLAGLFLARASGFRSPTDSLSGDIRQSSTGLLAEADTLTREGLWPEAIDIYDEVLDISPANTEALTYRGWLTARLGEPEAGLADLDEAVAVDPDFPDARVFRAILLDDEQRFDEAAAELAALDALNVTGQIAGLVEASGLRASVAAGQIAQRFGEPGTTVDLDEIQAELPDIVDAGVVLSELDAELAIRVFDAVIERDPENVTALVGSGNIKTNPEVIAASPETGAEGLALLDRALDLAPDNDQIHLFRAFARMELDDLAGASEDFTAIDPDGLPEALLDPYARLEILLG